MWNKWTMQEASENEPGDEVHNKVFTLPHHSYIKENHLIRVSFIRWIVYKDVSLNR